MVDLVVIFFIVARVHPFSDVLYKEKLFSAKNLQFQWFL